MKCLHLWRRDELFEITFEFKWKQPDTKGLLTNNLCPLNRFWLSKNPFTQPPSLFLTYNIKLNIIPTKIKRKIQACFILYFKFFEGTSVKRYKIQLPVLLFLVLHQFLYQQISFFYNFLELNSTLSAKDFRHKFSFINRFTQTSHPLNGQNLLSVTKDFCQFSLKCLLNTWKWNFRVFLVLILHV